MSEFVHKCGELGCPYFKQPSPKNCGCHNTDYQMMNAELTALRTRVAQLEGALFNATALIGHAMPMDTTALVAGEKLVARDVWNVCRQVASDGRS